MRQLSRSLSWVALFSIFSSLGSQTASGVEKIRPRERAYLSRISSLRSTFDSRKTRSFVLPNELEVLVIHDPAAQKSAAALDVRVGSLSDPPNHRGLAHYLEHMLFLGTAKFPQVSSFDDFLGQNGGDSNASTGLENTNFHFECNPSAFPQALDRFASFFIHPLFNRRYIDRELKNIDSEFSKNLLTDGYRVNHLLRTLSDPRHPMSREFQGNLETLKDFPRATLVQFYETYYSANIMKLAIITPSPLDEAEQWVRTSFSEVPNKNASVPKFSPYVENRNLFPQLVQVKSVQNNKSLQLYFSLPSYQRYSLSTPQTILTYLLNYEGKGSLGSFLKEAGLIHELYSAPSQDSFRSEWQVQMELTDAGFENWEQIVELFFRYIQMLRDQGLSRSYFKDMQRTAELDHFFNQPGSGIEAASHYADQMQSFRPEMIDVFNDLEVRYSPKTFIKTLDQVVPNKMQIVLLAPKIYTNTKEPLFQVRYRTTALKKSLVEKWKTVSALSVFHYPPTNEFLPERIDVEGKTDHVPVKIRDNPMSQLWLKRDHVYKKPKAVLTYRISVPHSQTVPHKLLAVSLTRAVNEHLIEWSARAAEVGYEVGFEVTEEGFQIRFSGYSNKLEHFAKEAISQIAQVELGKLKLQDLRANLEELLLDHSDDSPMELAIGRLDLLLRPAQKSDEELRSGISQLTLDQFKNYKKDAFSEVYIRGIGFGQIEEETLSRVTDHMINTFHSSPFTGAQSSVGNTTEILLPEGQAYHHPMSTHGVDHAWLLDHQFGKTTPELRAQILIGDIFIQNAFYNELRTRESLGYIVGSTPRILPELSSYTFKIQSNQNLAKVSQLSERFISKRIEEMSQLSDEEFESLKRGVLESFNPAGSDFEEKAEHFSDLLFSWKGTWNLPEQAAAALQAVTKQDVIATWKKAFSPETRRRLTVTVSGEQGVGKWIPLPGESEISEVNFFK